MASQRGIHQVGTLQRLRIQIHRSAHRHLQSAADFFPRPGDAGQHDDGSGRHPAAFGTLYAVVEADHRRPYRGILARQLANVRGCDPRPLRDALGRIFLHLFAQLLETQRVLCNIVGIVQALADDDMHHAESKGGVGSGIDRQVPVGAFRSSRAVRVNDHEFRAVAPRLGNERPQVHVVAVNVRGPRNDVFGMAELLGFGSQLHAQNRFQPCFSSRRADGSIQLRSP